MIIVDTILDEALLGPNGAELQDWLQTNAADIRIVPVDLDVVGLRYGVDNLVAGGGNDAGDFAIRFVLDNLDDPMIASIVGDYSSIGVITDDKIFYNRLKYDPSWPFPDETYKSSLSFLVEDWATGRLSGANFEIAYSAIMEYFSLTNSMRNPSLNEVWLKEFRGLSDAFGSLADDLSSNTFLNFSGDDILSVATSYKVLSAVGFIGDVLGFAVTATEAARAYEEVGPEASQQIWAGSLQKVTGERIVYSTETAHLYEESEKVVYDRYDVVNTYSY